MTAERVRIAEAAKITGLAIRTLQDKAASGLIPGARRTFGRWTFDVQSLRRLGRSPCQKTSSRETGFAGRVSRSGGSNIVSAYELVLKQKRSGG